MAQSARLRELAAVGYEAFVRSCGGLDATNGTLLGAFDRLPSRAQQGWMDGVRAVLGEVYRAQEAAKAAQAALDALPPVDTQTATAASRVEEKPVEAPASKPAHGAAHKPAGHTAASKPRK